MSKPTENMQLENAP